MDEEQSVPEQTNGTSNGKEETVVDQTETVVETVAKSKVLNVAPPEEVPENFSEYLSDSTATAEEGGDKSAASVPTSVIQSVPKADTDKEEAENLEEKKEIDNNLEEKKEIDNNLGPEVTEAPDLLQEESPKEASCTVADLIDETEEEENSKEELEEE